MGKMKWFKRALIGILGLVILVLIYFLFVTRDRHPNFGVDLLIDANPAGQVYTGFSARSITPAIPDSWEDVNGDAQYKPEDGDIYSDDNGNGKFDPVWIAGFQNQRPAQGIHDTLWARAMVIGDGHSKVALVALDAIGFGADDAIAVRKAIPISLGISYAIVTSTHTHEAPDLLGLWGASEFKSGLNEQYQDFVRAQATQAIVEADRNMRPARIEIAQELEDAASLVEDSRKPIILDAGIRLLHAVDMDADTTLGVLFNWANHPETLWNKNLLLSSDFPHFVRQAIEEGISYNDSIYQKGLGGTCIYVNGAVGGLMTSSPRFPIQDPFLDTAYLKPSFDKARAQGYRLAQMGLRALSDTGKVQNLERTAIRLKAITFEIPMHNPLYRLASFLRIIDRGYSGWMQIRTEVCYWQLGPVSFLHYPGELYPEILNGGVEQPQGQDFILEPVETPALRSLMSGDFKFSVGLSNDMIGYIIPKSEWDQKPPFIYQYKNAPYGEINSVGPETAPIIYDALVDVIRALLEKGN